MALILNQAITADGSTGTATIINPNNGISPYQNVAMSGGFGGGTATVELSNDGGSTWFDATDSSGSVALAAPGMVRLFGVGNANIDAANTIKMRVTVAGSTAPTLKITITDVR